MIFGWLRWTIVVLLIIGIPVFAKDINDTVKNGGDVTI